MIFSSLAFDNFCASVISAYFLEFLLAITQHGFCDVPMLDVSFEHQSIVDLCK